MIEELIAVLLILAVTYALTQNYSPVADSYALRARAPHRRMKPVSATFNPDFVYVLYRLSNDTNTSRLFSESPRRLSSLMRVSPQMQLDEHYSRNGYSILDNIRQVLRDRGYDPRVMCHSVWYMTLPILCGLTHLNNMTMAYIYGDGKPTATLFITNNTSGERHFYFVDQNAANVKTAPDGSRYQYNTIMPRAFHVSPTESRGGYYKFSWNYPLDHDDGTAGQAIRTPDFRVTLLDKQKQAVSVTRLQMQRGEAITAPTVMKILGKYLFSNVMLVKHLVKQGWLLHVKHKIPLYSAPPLTTSHLNPTQATDQSGFLGLPAQSALSRWAQGMVVDALTAAVKLQHQDVRISVEYTDAHIPPVIIEADNEKEKKHLSLLVRSFDFYKQVLIAPNPAFAANVLSQHCEDLVRVDDLGLFENVLRSTKIEDTSHSLMYTRQAYKKLISADDAPKVPFSLNIESFISVSWLASLVTLLVYLEWVVLKSFYSTLGVRTIPHLTPWKPLNRLSVSIKK